MTHLLKMTQYQHLLTSALLAFCLSTSIYSDSYAQRLNQSVNKNNELPVIGEPADRMLSPAEERIIGINALRNFYRNGVVLEDSETAHYIQHIGNRLTNTLGTDKHEFTFFVVKDRKINAFAMPGGFIGVNAGLILATNNENELAGVLAHEIAHVTQRHIARRLADMQESSLPTLGAVIAGILLGMGGNADAGQALMLSGLAANVQRQLNFTRAHEIEADRIGFDLLYRAGFNPSGMADFFKVLQRDRISINDDEFEFLRTHPLDKTRISEAKIRAARLPDQTNPDSLNYHIIKSRLEALTSNNTFALVHALEKDAKNKQDANSVINRYAYSQALELNGNNEQAADILKSVVKTDKENANFQIALARTLQHSGNIKQALDILEHIYKLYPDHYPTILHYAKTLKSADQLEHSIKVLENFLTYNKPYTNEIYKLLAELYATTGKPIESKKQLAEYYFRNGNFNAAIQQLRDALKEKEIDYITRSQIEQLLKTILIASRDQ